MPCCVRTTPLVADPLWTHHWFHHGIQPAVATAIAIRAATSPRAVQPPWQRPQAAGRCVVAAPVSLVRTVHASPMVRFLFENILTQGRFNVSSYVSHDAALRWPCIGVGPNATRPTRPAQWVSAWAAELRRARAQFLRACGIVHADRPRRGGGAVLYERNANRHLANRAEVQTVLSRFQEGASGPPQLLMHNSHAPPCSVVRPVAFSHLLLTVHGFNSAVALFLPPGAAFVEVFPREYSWPDGAISHTVSALGVQIGHLYGAEVPPPLLQAPWPAFLARAFRHLPPPSKLTDKLPLVSMLRRTAHRMHNVHANTTELTLLIRALRNAAAALDARRVRKGATAPPSAATSRGRGSEPEGRSGVLCVQPNGRVAGCRGSVYGHHTAAALRPRKVASKSGTPPVTGPKGRQQPSQPAKRKGHMAREHGPAPSKPASE